MPEPHNQTATPIAAPKAVPSRELRFRDLYGVLMSIVTPYGILASNGTLFRAVFGRDSLRVALDLLPWHPELAERVIISLGVLQGATHNEITEEEPGRIHHEYRSLYMDGSKATTDQRHIMEKLADVWGWRTEGKEMCYYGSVDATPQYVRLVALHVSRYGPDILDRVFVHYTGKERTVRDAVIEAMSWIEGRIKTSSLGLVEFQRSNKKGIRWQVLRDGTVSYLHEDGSLVQANGPVASIEVQGLAYDALTMAAALFEETLPEKAERWREMARHIQETVFDLFWIEQYEYFAMALDRAPDGSVRQVRTRTSTPAELLDSGIFDTLEAGEREYFVAAIVHEMYSSEFLTPVGLRCRAKSHGNMLPYWDYQGSYTSWPVLTNIFALGLRRQGLIHHAFDMEKRVLNAANIAGALPEFFYVDDQNEVRYNVHTKKTVSDAERATRGREEHAEEQIRATNKPEQLQAWTVSAVLRAKLARRDAVQGLDTQAPFESRLKRRTGLSHVKARLLRGYMLTEAYPATETLVDKDAGFQAEHDHLESVLENAE